MSQVLPSAQPVSHQQNNPTDNMSDIDNVTSEFNQNTAINVDASEVEKFNTWRASGGNKPAPLPPYTKSIRYALIG